jgi:hypothetical protein
MPFKNYEGSALINSVEQSQSAYHPPAQAMVMSSGLHGLTGIAREKATHPTNSINRNGPQRGRSHLSGISG